MDRRIMAVLGVILAIGLVVLIPRFAKRPPEPREAPAQEVVETDVVVIGAGGAGLAAAVSAAEGGAEVIVLEKMPAVGGNTLRATGGMNAAGTPFQEALGISDSPEIHYEDTMTGGRNRNNPDLVRVLTQQAPAAVSWLTELGADMSGVGRLGGATNPRAHRPASGEAVGPEIVKVLQAAANEAGVQILLETKAKRLLVNDDGRVYGVIAEKEDGDIQINARAVVLATGGFGANQEMVTEFVPELEGFATTNHPGATGDGITMAREVGAKLIDMDQIQTHPTVVPERGIMITEAVRGNGAILVNRAGERFVNELETRDVVSAAVLEQEGGSAFLLFDQQVRESLAAIEKYVSMGLVTEADSLEGLADDLKIPADALTETVERYNSFVEAGKDEDFGREDLPVALTQAPFYAIEITPAVHHTMGGVAIDTEARVLNEDGKPIPGLYAAGEVTGGVHGANRLGGNALADIIVFGRIAGKSAVEGIE